MRKSKHKKQITIEVKNQLKDKVVEISKKTERSITYIVTRSIEFSLKKGLFDKETKIMEEINGEI